MNITIELSDEQVKSIKDILYKTSYETVEEFAKEQVLTGLAITSDWEWLDNLDEDSDIK